MSKCVFYPLKAPRINTTCYTLQGLNTLHGVTVEYQGRCLLQNTHTCRTNPTVTMRVMASFLILACQCGATGMFVRGVHTARSIKMSLINACKSSPVFHYTSLSSLLVLVYAQGRGMQQSCHRYLGFSAWRWRAAV